MRQLFFVPQAPLTEYPQVMGATFHIWTDDDGKSIGVAHMDGNCDSEAVVSALEKLGCSWLPNHHGNTPIGMPHVKHLEKHGVRQGDTTLQAMEKVHMVSGFHPLRPRRF